MDDQMLTFCEQAETYISSADRTGLIAEKSSCYFACKKLHTSVRFAGDKKSIRFTAGLRALNW